MHELSVLSDFIDLFVIFTILSFIIILKQFFLPGVLLDVSRMTYHDFLLF